MADNRNIKRGPKMSLLDCEISPELSLLQEQVEFDIQEIHKILALETENMLVKCYDLKDIKATIDNDIMTINYCYTPRITPETIITEFIIVNYPHP